MQVSLSVSYFISLFFFSGCVCFTGIKNNWGGKLENKLNSLFRESIGWCSDRQSAAVRGNKIKNINIGGVLKIHTCRRRTNMFVSCLRKWRNTRRYTVCPPESAHESRVSSDCVVKLFDYKSIIQQMRSNHQTREISPWFKIFFRLDNRNTSMCFL